MAQFVFLPDEGKDPAAALASLANTAAGPTMFHTASAGGVARRRSKKSPVRIIDQFEATGVALVEVAKPADADLAGGALHPVITYQLAIAEPRAGRLRLGRSMGPAGADHFRLRVRSTADGSPVVGAVVQLRLKGSSQEISAVTDSAGLALFGLRAPALKGAAVTVEPGFHGHWGYYDRKADLASGDVLDIDPIDLGRAPDVLRAILPPGADSDGAGVVVGVIDTGVGPHRDLPNAKGDVDTSFGHGTHVAGIVAARGSAPYRGIAPGAEIRSYRVFSDPLTGVAKNFDIHVAIEQAARDGCHLINLSLKSERTLDPRFDDRVISRALEDAAARGVLAIAAAGNDFRRFVAFPARHRDVLSVSAFGADSRMPGRAYDRWTISADRANSDADVFFATFSNQGVDDTEVDLTAPGAGVVSAVPGDRYAPMSGTSMACPAATGAIARILSRQAHILAMPADRRRFDAMRDAALTGLRRMGFTDAFEGRGMVA
jgi:subtilisin